MDDITRVMASLCLCLHKLCNGANKISHCSKVQIFSQWEPIAATIEGALMLVRCECYFYLFHFHMHCSTIHKIVLFDIKAYLYLYLYF